MILRSTRMGKMQDELTGADWNNLATLIVGSYCEAASESPVEDE